MSTAAFRLKKGIARAISDFDMIQNGDRILVAVSGGKDSYAMLHLLRDLQRRAPVDFTLKVVNVDQGHPGYPAQVLRDFMEREAFDFTMVEENTYAIVTEKIPAGKTFCSLCSRLRRGILYRVAQEMGCTKIALGHHRDDILQTFMLNLQFAGQLAAMPPKLISNDGKNVVIRPLVYCAEDDIQSFSDEQQFPILPCDLCGSQDNLQRRVVGRALDALEAARPGTKNIMLAALQNVRPSQLIDKGLWRSLGLAAAQERDDDRGVIAPSRLVRPHGLSVAETE
jgi:tRNA 2-thiocytidine biosynthesis protein TtcA